MAAGFDAFNETGNLPKEMPAAKPESSPAVITKQEAQQQPQQPPQPKAFTDNFPTTLSSDPFGESASDPWNNPNQTQPDQNGFGDAGFGDVDPFNDPSSQMDNMDWTNADPFAETDNANVDPFGKDPFSAEKTPVNDLAGDPMAGQNVAQEAVRKLQNEASASKIVEQPSESKSSQNGREVSELTNGKAANQLETKTEIKLIICCHIYIHLSFGHQL